MTTRSDWDGGLAGISKESLDVLQKASAYRALEASEGYKRLLDFLEIWANQALENMRAATHREDDRTRTNLQLIWAGREEALAEIQREVQRCIAAGRQLASEIDHEALDLTELPIEFGDNNES